MIRRFVEAFDQSISASPFVLSSAIEKYLSPDAHCVYIKGIIRFIDMPTIEEILSEIGAGIFASET